MNDGIDIRTNLPALKAHLNRISADFEQKVMRQATSAAAVSFRGAVKAKAPVLAAPRKGRVAGTLKRAIYVKRSRDRSSGREHYYLGVRKGRSAQKSGRDAFYWYFLEAGWIPRGRGKKLKGGERSRALQRKRLLAGGAQKIERPFIKPGFESGKGAALKAFYARAEKAIAKYSTEQTPR